MPTPSFYQREVIGPILSRMGRSDLSPRIVEAYLRVYHSTLDAMSRMDFEREIKRFLPVIDSERAPDQEALARSYGL